MNGWNDIPDYEGLYQISIYGEVRSLDKKVEGRKGIIKGKLMKQGDNGRGYKNIMLVNEQGRKLHYVHRLMALTFLQPIDNKEFVNHIDGNKSNNNISNLEWCDRSENMLHANSIGLCPQYDRSGNKNPATKIVLDIATGVYYDTMKEAANLYGISVGFLSGMLNNRIKNKTNLRYV